MQNRLTSLADDVEATRRILALQDGPTVLVAHSWGGMVISEAGVDSRVSALVYVAARAPDAGEDYTALAARSRARVLYAVQGRIAENLFSGKTTKAAWRSKPSWYAISTDDRTIAPDLQRFMASRMKAKTIEVKASHLSLISHPEQITNLILEAAGHRR